VVFDSFATLLLLLTQILVCCIDRLKPQAPPDLQAGISERLLYCREQTFKLMGIYEPACLLPTRYRHSSSAASDLCRYLVEGNDRNWIIVRTK
jgi:hypothetical protein